MYGYYYLSALGFKKVTFVKKYITSAQMIQFSLDMLQTIYNLSIFYMYGKAPYPIELNLILFFYMISMLSLFANFFVKDRMREKSVIGDKKRK